MAIQTLAAIDGVQVVDLEMHADDRGVFTEVFRETWGLGITPVQWNVVRSDPGVLRGVHVHPVHDDYLVVLGGLVSIGLRDLRPRSRTHGASGLVTVSGERLKSIVIPHGVAHGFLFHEPSLHAYAVSHYWDTDDELACVWWDPDLEIDWPLKPTKVSDRDASAQSLASLIEQLEERAGFG